MDISGQSQGQLVEILIKLAGSLTEEDLMDPATFALASQLVQMLDPKADPLPQELVDQLKNIQNKAIRFKMAAQAIGANRPDLMDKLVDSMKAAGLWKAEAHIKKMDWRRRNAQFKHQDRQEEEKELTKAEPPAKPTFNQHIRSVAESYAEPRGIHLQHDIPKVKVNPEFASKVATAYHGLEHSPAHPQTKAAYDALIDETTQQLHHLQRNGYKFTPIKPGQANPYASGSAALAADLRDNKHAHYYPTEQGFGSGDSMHPDHPLLRTVKDLDGNEMPANDAFRIVHDVFGHAKEGTSFGPQGEEAAYRHHYQMFSPLARRALTAETRGQNSWVNFGPHAAHNRANPDRTVFAEQKAGLLPEWAEEHYSDEVKKSEDLDKGAMQRLYPVARHPKKPEGLGEWQDGGGDRNDVPHERDPAVRERMFHKLASKTKVSIGGDGKRRFLLHRGENKSDPSIQHPSRSHPFLSHTSRSSWTPHFDMALSHAKDGAEDSEDTHVVHSAWVHEDKIASVPLHYGNVNEDTGLKGKNSFRSEHEVIVEPHHDSELHDDVEVDSSSVGTRREDRFGPNINNRINARVKKSEDLDKGINGDWEKEGYTFRTSRSKKAGHTVKAYKGRTRVGHMAFSEMPDSKDGYHHVYAAHISEDHRGKGLYQEMIRQGVKHAQSLGSKGLKTDGFQRSGDATRAWEKINPEKRETNPSMIGGKRFSFYADERHLNKSEDLEKGSSNKKDFSGEDHVFTTNDEIPDYVGRDLSDRVSNIQTAPIEHVYPNEKVDQSKVEKIKGLIRLGHPFPAIVANFGHNEKNPEWDGLSVVDGHHRLEAAKQLGMTHVPVRVAVSSDDWPKVKQAGGFKLNFGKSEFLLNKSNNDHYLEHYSAKDAKFDTLDPNFHGTGVSGDERKRWGRPNRTYYYDKGTANEPRVTEPAKFKYIVKAPGKILDLDSKEAKPHMDAAKTSAGIVDHTQLEHNIKNAGYDGYRHSGSALPNVVALFHAQKPTEVHDLREVKKSEGSDLNKSDTSEHFAVALHRKFGYPIRAIMNKDKVVGHFYAHDPKTGHALDVSGRKQEGEIPKTFKGMGSTDHYHIGNERDLHALMGRKVDEKGVSAALNIINRAPDKYAPSHFKSEESAKAEAAVSNKETILKKAQDLIDRLRKSGKDKEADILEESLSKTDDHSYNIYTVPGREGEHHVFADNVNEFDEENHPKNVGYMHIQDNNITHISVHPAHRSNGLPARMYKKAKLLVSSDVKKSELDSMVVYEELIKGKNRREQQSKVFGGWKTSPDSPRRAKQMAALEDQGKRRYGLETERAPGKENASGKIIDKPTFDNPGNKIQHIGNPDSLVHEHAHLEVEKEGSGLKQFQADMDHEWGAQNKKFGYKQQARGKEEYSTTALENPLRRRAGLPAHQKETKEKNPKRDYAADVPGKKITQEIPGGKRLTGTSSNRTPEHNRRMDQVDRGELKFNPEKGWQPGTSANSKINQRARAIAENPANSGRKDFKTLMRGEDGSKPLSFNDMKKADLAKSWEIKMKGQEGYHPVKDVVDQGPGKQNAYILHDGTKIDHERIEDLRIGGKNVKDTTRNTGPTPLKPKR